MLLDIRVGTRVDLLSSFHLLFGCLSHFNAVGQFRADPIKLGEDIARTILSWAWFFELWVTFILLKGGFCEFDALSNVMENVVYSVDEIGVAYSRT